MQFMLLIYHGALWEQIPNMSDEDKAKFGKEYAAVLQTAGVTPGAPLGRPEDATTIRVDDGKILTSDGPFVNTEGAIGGSLLLEAESLDDAIELAARIPAARFGGAIEIRRVGQYW